MAFLTLPHAAPTLRYLCETFQPPHSLDYPSARHRTPGKDANYWAQRASAKRSGWAMARGCRMVLQMVLPLAVLCAATMSNLTTVALITAVGKDKVRWVFPIAWEFLLFPACLLFSCYTIFLGSVFVDAAVLATVSTQRCACFPFKRGFLSLAKIF